jgi:uncharacterized protein YndB with AHSA1/START domain
MKWLGIIIAVLVGLVVIVVAIGAMLPKAHTATRSAHFSQTPDAIWQVITTPEAFPTWRTNVKTVERLPDHDGHISWRETDNQGQAIPFEIVEWTPPSRLVTRIADPKLPFGGTWTYEIQADQTGGGSTLRITENGEVYNPLFRFVSRFVLGHHATMDEYLRALRKKFGEVVRLEN